VVYQNVSQTMLSSAKHGASLGFCFIVLPEQLWQGPVGQRDGRD
jgi:hypothetical protein